MIVVGERLYGKVDVLPGLFFVKTRFLHAYWVPLVPRESYLLLDPALAGEGRGVRIPLRWKSVWVAWYRAFFVLTMPMHIAAMLSLLLNPKLRQAQHAAVSFSISFALAAIFGGFFWMTYRTSRADMSRALELGQLLGMRQEDVERHYRKANPERLP